MTGLSVHTFGCPVATAGESVAGDFARGCRDGSRPAQRGDRGSLRSRCGLVPYLQDAFSAECVQKLKGYGVQFDVAGV